MIRATAFGHQASLPNDSEITPVVFVVDHDISVRQSLEWLIRSEGWRPETFSFPQEFLARPRANVPSCLVLDAALPGRDGLEVQKRIAKERAETPIIFVTTYRDVRTTVQAMKAGAVEFLIKPFKNEALLGAIREGLECSRIALDRELEMRELQTCYASLSRRERQVMALVVSGLLNKQAGGELGISEITVKAHRRHVMRRMKAESFADLVRMAERLGLENPVTKSSLLRLAS